MDKATFDSIIIRKDKEAREAAGLVVEEVFLLSLQSIFILLLGLSQYFFCEVVRILKPGGKLLSVSCNPPDVYFTHYKHASLSLISNGWAPFSNFLLTFACETSLPSRRSSCVSFWDLPSYVHRRALG